MGWPNDPDGDVFRMLHSQGFDFSKTYLIDFNVDFDNWPPKQIALATQNSLVGEVTLFEPDQYGPGFAQFRFRGMVTYEKVIEIQRQVTDAMTLYGGRCESWGVMGDVP